jgi:hypothetical protein
MKTITALHTNIDLIGTNEIEALVDTLNLCFFKNLSQKDSFWKAVLRAGKSNTIQGIRLENFDSAFLTAKSILRKRGQEVFKSMNTHSRINIVQQEVGGILGEDSKEPKLDLEQEDDEILQIIK